MNCPRCNVELSFKKTRCDNCGQDLKNYRKVLSASNTCYNKGLAQAKVRDLSGAVVSLHKSLKFNKKNTNARNLLGLIYFEEGEIVAALSEWVISKHFQEEHNEADYYIRQVQSNPNKLENYNQMVKKYNTALLSAQNGDEDMAIIQLKKVVNMNPKFIRANQLLALLYMMTGKKENRVKAYRLMKNISTVDVTNTTTLCYLKELADVKPKHESIKVKTEEKKDPGVRKVLPRVDETAYKPITPYKEEKPSVMPFIHVVLGVVLGMVIAAFLIRPAIEQQIAKSSNDSFRKQSEQQASGESNTSNLKSKNEQLQEQVDELNAKLSELQGGDSASGITTMQDNYENLIAAVQSFYVDNDSSAAAEALVKVDKENLSGTTAQKLYRKIKKQTFATASESYFTKGRDCYNGEGDYAGKQNYDKAIELLKKALDYDTANTDAMYFLGRCYQQKKDMETAKEYYNQIVNDYPDSARTTEAKSRLREMGE